MSKQTTASERWEANNYRVRKAKIERLLQDAKDYSFPAGQAQAGIQLGTVEVPWLLEYIEELKEQINGSGQNPAQELAA
jgi:hypothetical protein